MKKQVIPIVIIAVLAVGQFAAWRKVKEQEQMIENLSTKLYEMDDRWQSRINDIYRNIDEMLQKEASLLTNAEVAVGELDVDTLMVPISYTITPKEVSQHTKVYLDFDGEKFSMEQEGDSFYGVVNRPLFGEANPRLVIEEGGVTKTEDSELLYLWNLHETVLPALSAQFVGSSGYDGEVYRKNGDIHADYKSSNYDVSFTKAVLVTTVEDNLVSEKHLDINLLSGKGYELEETYPLKEGETLKMTVVATDSLGLVHHYRVDYFTAGEGEQWETWFGREEIYSPKGELIFQEEF